MDSYVIYLSELKLVSVSQGTLELASFIEAKKKQTRKKQKNVVLYNDYKNCRMYRDSKNKTQNKN